MSGESCRRVRPPSVPLPLPGPPTPMVQSSDVAGLGQRDRYRVSLASRRRRRILAIVGLTWASALVVSGFDAFAHLASRPDYNGLAGAAAAVCFPAVAAVSAALASTIPQGMGRRVGAAALGAVGSGIGAVLLFLACTSALWIFVPINP